jgi:hypothetical protein
MANALRKVRHAANQGSNQNLIKRNLEDPNEFFDWLTHEPGMDWDVLNIRKYHGPLLTSDLIAGSHPAYFLIISSEKGYSVMIDREKGEMRIYYPDGGDELEDGTDAGKFHVLCF